MGTKDSGQPTVQATQVTYELHTLGWKAFQDLCIAVAEEVLKRPVESFLQSRDGGRDGAFIGHWTGAPGTAEAGKSTIQCKFTSMRSAPLHLSGVKDELTKAKRLARRGLAGEYILLTNHPVSGESNAEISKAFEDAGVGRCRIFGGDWITDQIRRSARLRFMVPRVYGLGDLSQILDERAYAQSRAILSALGEDLSRFVVTDAHRRSVKAILDHQFVLLLGDPASGKSTIAASLALGALDHWGSQTIRINSPEELVRHWNPHEPSQFFWVDDAFGATQYQRQMTDSWNRQLPLMNTALRRGARFLLTSRTYIWRAAHHDLKTSAFPLFDQSQVVIDVQGLSATEKAQILYNHIKLGDQPAAYRSKIKPFLPGLAADESFLPETARRLGNQFFTKQLSLTQAGVLDFSRRPVAFLKDVLRNLDPNAAAAIALVFMHGGAVPSPIETDERTELIAELLGIRPSDLRQALDALHGSLLVLVEGPKSMHWSFKHPTIGDAYAELVAESPELMEIYLRGAKHEQLLREVVCSGITIEGAAVHVPQRLYPMLLSRVIEKPVDYRLRYFLAQRCDRNFLMLALESLPALLDLRIYPSMAYSIETRLLARLHELGLLPEIKRKVFIEHVVDITVSIPDGAVFRDDRLRSLFTEDEFEELLQRLRTETMEQLGALIFEWKNNCSADDDPESHFDEFEGMLKDVIEHFEEEPTIVKKAEDGIKHIRRAIESLYEDRYSPPEMKVEAPTGQVVKIKDSFRMIFDDIDR